MKPFAHRQLSHNRVTRGPLASDSSYGNNGCFLLPHKGEELFVIVSDGDGWDHVSVSLRSRCPTWAEMCFVKAMFFDPEEAVMQLHPPKSDYVNYHRFCLHLWRPQAGDIPLPPSWMVGPKQEAVQ
jgi:hypothetical protein